VIGDKAEFRTRDSGLFSLDFVAASATSDLHT